MKKILIIVVLVVLVLLASLPFINILLEEKVSEERDTFRISVLNSLAFSMDLTYERKDLPLPTDNTEIADNGKVIGYVGTAGTDVIEYIDMSGLSTVDPKTKKPFNYYLSTNQKTFLFTTCLENTDNGKALYVKGNGDAKELFSEFTKDDCN